MYLPDERTTIRKRKIFEKDIYPLRDSFLVVKLPNIDHDVVELLQYFEK